MTSPSVLSPLPPFCSRSVSYCVTGPAPYRINTLTQRSQDKRNSNSLKSRNRERTEGEKDNRDQPLHVHSDLTHRRSAHTGRTAFCSQGGSLCHGGSCFSPSEEKQEEVNESPRMCAARPGTLQTNSDTKVREFKISSKTEENDLYLTYQPGFMIFKSYSVI